MSSIIKNSVLAITFVFLLAGCSSIKNSDNDLLINRENPQLTIDGAEEKVTDEPLEDSAEREVPEINEVADEKAESVVTSDIGSSVKINPTPPNPPEFSEPPSDLIKPGIEPDESAQPDPEPDVELGEPEVLNPENP